MLESKSLRIGARIRDNLDQKSPTNIGKVPPWYKKNITVFESDVGTSKSIFNGSSANTKIELRNVRCLLPAKMAAHFLKLEAREIAILLDRQKLQNAITN